MNIKLHPENILYLKHPDKLWIRRLLKSLKIVNTNFYKMLVKWTIPLYHRQDKNKYKNTSLMISEI